MPTANVINFGSVFPVVIIFILILFGLGVILLILKTYFSSRRYFNHQIFLIKIPKNTDKKDEGDLNVQNIKEEIAKGETIFASIGGLRAQRGLKAWFFGRDDHISFEIVANNKQIAFYYAVPEKDVRYLEQQIHAHYPEAVSYTHLNLPTHYSVSTPVCAH